MAFIKYKDGEEYRIFQLPNDGMAIFGRDESSDFQICLDPRVSREHFSIEINPITGKYTLTDLGSKNMTKHNGAKLCNTSSELSDGDEIEIGVVELTYHETIPLEDPTTVFVDAVNSIKSGDGFKTIMFEVVNKKK